MRSAKVAAIATAAVVAVVVTVAVVWTVVVRGVSLNVQVGDSGAGVSQTSVPDLSDMTVDDFVDIKTSGRSFVGVCADYRELGIGATRVTIEQEIADKWTVPDGAPFTKQDIADAVMGRLYVACEQ